jgi:RHS repeat-associated protein
LGSDTVVKQYYGQPEITLNYGSSTSGSYPGLDQFDRVVNQTWTNSSGTIDSYSYGYDAAGNVTYRKNNTASGLDQVYGYDYLGQLTSLEQGQIATSTVDGNTVVTVNSTGYASLSSDTQNYSQSWTLDGLGNWTSYGVSSTADSSLDETQTRTPTANNEIGTLSSTAGATWAQPYYDAAGNMTTVPQPGNESNGMAVQYDAWNRVVNVTSTASGDTFSITYSYDGLGRMVSRTSGTSVTYYLYAGQQLLETRVGTTSDTPQTAAIQYQYVWSPTGINVPILRDTYSDGAVVAADRLYYLTDANNNVTAVTDDTGAVQERYSYDAYGNVTIYDADWVQRSASEVNNTLLFAGMMVDPTTGMYYARARWYDPSTGSFITEDPAQAETNLYGYAGNDPISESDPTGLVVNVGYPSTTCNTGDAGSQSIPAGLTISTSDGSGQYITGEHNAIQTWPEQIASFFPLDRGDALALQMAVNQSTPPGNGVPPVPTELDRESIAAQDKRYTTVYNNSVASGASAAATYYTTAGMYFADHTGVTNLSTVPLPYIGSSQEPVTLQEFSFNQRLARAAAGSFQITTTALTIESVVTPCSGAINNTASRLWYEDEGSIELPFGPAEPPAGGARGTIALGDTNINFTESELSQLKIDGVSPFNQAASDAGGEPIQAVQTADGRIFVMQGNNRVKGAVQQGLPSVDGNIFTPQQWEDYTGLPFVPRGTNNPKITP